MSKNDQIALFKEYKKKFGWFEGGFETDKKLISSSELIFLSKQKNIKADHKLIHNYRENGWIPRAKVDKSPVGPGMTSYFLPDVYFNFWAINEIQAINKDREPGEFIDHFKLLATRDIEANMDLDKETADVLAVFVWPKYFSGEIFTNLKHFKEEEFVDLLAELIERHEELVVEDLLPGDEEIIISNGGPNKKLEIPLSEAIILKLKEKIT